MIAVEDSSYEEGVLETGFDYVSYIIQTTIDIFFMSSENLLAE